MLVVGDAATLKVHLHTDEPELATAVFADAGEVSRLDVADMHLQVAEREARLAELPAVDDGGGALNGLAGRAAGRACLRSPGSPLAAPAPRATAPPAGGRGRSSGPRGAGGATGRAREGARGPAAAGRGPLRSGGGRQRLWDRRDVP